MLNTKSQAETKDDSELMPIAIPSSQNVTKPNVGCCYLTVKQVSDACEKNAYLLFRFNSGYQMGVNGKIVILARKRSNKKDNDKRILSALFHVELMNILNISTHMSYPEIG